MSTQSNGSGSSIGFTGLLTVAFVVLKLTGYIDWSWWWVLAPLWIGPVIAVLFFAIAYVFWAVDR